MVIGEQVLLSQFGMNRRENSFITEGSRSRLDMSNQLWSLFITGLGEMYLVPCPECCSFLPIARVEVIWRGEELSSRQDWLWAPPPTLLSCLKLLLPHGAECDDGRQRFHPVWGRRSLERIEHHPAVGSYLIGVLFALFFLGSRNRSCSNRSPYCSTHSAGTWARTHSGATSERTFNT
jgi:hypothetical protein